MGVLNDREREEALARLDGWGYEDGDIVRTFVFHDFAQASSFVNKVATVAEERHHHPDIDIRYNKVILRLSSHDVGGVTERDLALAEAFDDLI
jgi:4a-hydroxytetrahydrobiopterin dehydratase